MNQQQPIIDEINRCPNKIIYSSNRTVQPITRFHSILSPNSTIYCSNFSFVSLQWHDFKENPENH